MEVELSRSTISKLETSIISQPTLRLVHREGVSESRIPHETIGGAGASLKRTPIRRCYKHLYNIMLDRNSVIISISDNSLSQIIMSVQQQFGDKIAPTLFAGQRDALDCSDGTPYEAEL